MGDHAPAPLFEGDRFVIFVNFCPRFCSGLDAGGASRQDQRRGMKITIRDEQPGDERGIHEVTRRAFETMAFSSKTEHRIVDALRAAGALAVSLVAVKDDQVVAHIAFSRTTLSQAQGAWFALGPVSVRPDHQRQGIGAALIDEGLRRLRALGAAGCVLVGHPQYYPRFGFRTDSTVVVPEVPTEVTLVMRLQPNAGAGVVAFHPAFFVVTAGGRVPSLVTKSVGGGRSPESPSWRRPR
jgi:putative acetyltransferase